MPNINAALGCAQLEQLPRLIEKKRQLAQKYIEIFKEVDGVNIFVEQQFAKSNYWLNVLLIENISKSFRDRLLEALNQNNIMARPVWNLLHTLEIYRGSPKMDLSKAEALERRIINIPSSPSI